MPPPNAKLHTDPDNSSKEAARKSSHDPLLLLLLDKRARRDCLGGERKIDVAVTGSREISAGEIINHF
jgi:hypothetical protein